jgi:hypothetical protein
MTPAPFPAEGEGAGLRSPASRTCALWLFVVRACWRFQSRTREPDIVRLQWLVEGATVDSVRAGGLGWSARALTAHDGQPGRVQLGVAALLAQSSVPPAQHGRHCDNEGSDHGEFNHRPNL